MSLLKLTFKYDMVPPASFNCHTMDDCNKDLMELMELMMPSQSLPLMMPSHFACLSFDDLSLDRVESNDPSLTRVRISSRILNPNDDDDRQHRLERLSTAIGRNTQLKALDVLGSGVRLNEAQAMILFRGIACSRSIKRLHFRSCGEYLGNPCRILTPLFKNNQVECILMYDWELSHEGIRLLTTSLTEFDSLKEFALTGTRLVNMPQQTARELVHALSGHSRLRELDLSSTYVGKLGCSALVDLLSNPNTNLTVLDLAYSRLVDAEAVALSSGMAVNTSLKEINLSRNWNIAQAGWQAIFDTLSSPSCRLEKLALEYNEINDAAAESLSNALAGITTLKTLNLYHIKVITLTGWRVLFDFLRSPTCTLENLAVGNNQLNDEVMDSLIDALASNRSLISLDLASNRGVTRRGWQRFVSTVLANPSSGLVKLDLAHCAGIINDAVTRALTNALVNNSKLKVLDLSHNICQITNTGWETFSSVLESPYTALEELDLGGNDVDDATLTSLVNSLSNNKKLKKLLCFDYSYDWEPPLSLLCNTNSIMSTYNSNHTLEELGGEDEMPEEFESLLQINRENSPSQAARLKIIKTHFNGGFITQPFVGMDLNVLPHAMAWMVRYCRACEVDGHYFSFAKSISSLFENAN